MRWSSAIALLLVGCTPDYDLSGNDTPDDLPQDTSVTVVDTFVTHPVDTDDTDVPVDSAVDETLPVAVCVADPTEVLTPLTSATFEGGGSYDPLGHLISGYDWTLLSVPAGSIVTMPSGNSANRTVTPDLAGAYIAQLVVHTDDLRFSAPCQTTLTGLAGDGLHVEMYWSHRSDDMDLHVLEPGGTPYDYQSDCYYANCTGHSLHWGPNGREDDPNLDIDDIPGTGPENTNIRIPYAGTYTVFVNDYTGSNAHDYQGANDVTVNLYLGGVLLWTDTRQISGDGADETFATIDIPSGVVTPQ
jgi:hypothetical protein